MLLLLFMMRTMKKVKLFDVFHDIMSSRIGALRVCRGSEVRRAAVQKHDEFTQENDYRIMLIEILLYFSL